MRILGSHPRNVNSTQSGLRHRSAPTRQNNFLSTHQHQTQVLADPAFTSRVRLRRQYDLSLICTLSIEDLEQTILSKNPERRFEFKPQSALVAEVVREAGTILGSHEWEMKLEVIQRVAYALHQLALHPDHTDESRKTATKGQELHSRLMKNHDAKWMDRLFQNLKLGQKESNFFRNLLPYRSALRNTSTTQEIHAELERIGLATPYDRLSPVVIFTDHLLSVKHDYTRDELQERKVARKYINDLKVAPFHAPDWSRSKENECWEELVVIIIQQRERLGGGELSLDNLCDLFSMGTNSASAHRSAPNGKPVYK
ncbi:hypothetical protein T439DRAFT_360775 [Meredithblackwellia eburnea MCA 4105]